MWTPLLLGMGMGEGGRQLNLLPNFEKKGGGLTGPQLWKRGCWKRGGNFFQEGGGLQFYKKNKVKSAIFNDNNSL